MSTDLTAHRASKEQADAAEKAKGLAALKRDLPHILEVTVIEAAMIRAKYMALLAAGFNEAQAIELCRKP